MVTCENARSAVPSMCLSWDAYKCLQLKLRMNDETKRFCGVGVEWSGGRVGTVLHREKFTHLDQRSLGLSHSFASYQLCDPGLRH